MFKKLLNLFGSGSKDEQTKREESYNDHQDRHSMEDEDEDDEEEEEENDDDDDEVIVYQANDGDRIVTATIIPNRRESELDPDTLHGTHYSVEDFDAEVERRLAQMIKEEEEDGEIVDNDDIFSMRTNAVDEIYAEWNGFDPGEDAILNFRQRNSKKYFGYASFGHEKMEDNVDNPLLAPIHGVTIEDYAAISYFVASGGDFNALVSKLGVDPTIWPEINTLWGKRMQEDTSFTVTTLFSQFYSTADQHPVLGGNAPTFSEEGKANIQKMEEDRYFYGELQAARTAAYEYGIDGAQWILDNYGVPLGEFQRIAANYSKEDNLNFNSKEQLDFLNFVEEKTEEYKKKFAAEQGGNVADDIEF